MEDSETVQILKIAQHHLTNRNTEIADIISKRRGQDNTELCKEFDMCRWANAAISQAMKMKKFK